MTNIAIVVGTYTSYVYVLSSVLFQNQVISKNANAKENERLILLLMWKN